jgi:hypothetical protein
MGGVAWGRVLIFFLFLAVLNPTINPTLYNPTKKREIIFGIFGEVFATIEVGLEKVELGVGLGVILWSFLVILPVPRILPQSYLKSC